MLLLVERQVDAAVLRADAGDVRSQVLGPAGFLDGRRVLVAQPARAVPFLYELDDGLAARAGRVPLPGLVRLGILVALPGAGIPREGTFVRREVDVDGADDVADFRFDLVRHLSRDLLEVLGDVVRRYGIVGHVDGIAVLQSVFHFRDDPAQFRLDVGGQLLRHLRHVGLKVWSRRRAPHHAVIEGVRRQADAVRGREVGVVGVQRLEIGLAATAAVAVSGDRSRLDPQADACLWTQHRGRQVRGSDAEAAVSERRRLS